MIKKGICVKKPIEKTELNQISLTGIRGLLILKLLMEAPRSLEELKADIEKNKANEDFLRFQYNELHSASLKSGEQEELEQQS